MDISDVSVLGKIWEHSEKEICRTNSQSQRDDVTASAYTIVE